MTSTAVASTTDTVPCEASIIVSITTCGCQRHDNMTVLARTSRVEGVGKLSSLQCAALTAMADSTSDAMASEYSTVDTARVATLLSGFAAPHNSQSVSLPSFCRSQNGEQELAPSAIHDNISSPLSTHLHRALRTRPLHHEHNDGTVRTRDESQHSAAGYTP